MHTGHLPVPGKLHIVPGKIAFNGAFKCIWPQKKNISALYGDDIYGNTFIHLSDFILEIMLMIVKWVYGFNISPILASAVYQPGRHTNIGVISTLSIHRDGGDGGDFNTLGPRQIRRYFADDIFKCMLLNENV